MHDYKIRKVDMRFVVEEMRAHQSVMDWGMVFGLVVSNIGAYGAPVNIKLALAGAIPDPVEAHAECLRTFLIDGVVNKSNRGGVINLHGSGGFGMPKFFECRTDG